MLVTLSRARTPPSHEERVRERVGSGHETTSPDTIFSLPVRCEDGAPIFALESMACCSDSSCNSPKVLYGGQL